MSYNCFKPLELSPGIFGPLLDSFLWLTLSMAFLNLAKRYEPGGKAVSYKTSLGQNTFLP